MVRFDFTKLCSWTRSTMEKNYLSISNITWGHLSSPPMGCHTPLVMRDQIHGFVATTSLHLFIKLLLPLTALEAFLTLYWHLY